MGQRARQREDVAAAAATVCRALRSREACLAGIDVEGGPSRSCLWCCGRSCWPGVAAGRRVLCEAAGARVGFAAAAFTPRWESSVRDRCAVDEPAGTPAPPKPTDPPTAPPSGEGGKEGGGEEHEEQGEEGKEEEESPVPEVGGLPMVWPPPPPGRADLVGLVMRLRLALAPFHFGYGSNPADGAPPCPRAAWPEQPVADTELSECAAGCKSFETAAAAQRECAGMGSHVCGGVVKRDDGGYELRRGKEVGRAGRQLYRTPCSPPVRRFAGRPTAKLVWDSFSAAMDEALADPELRLNADPPNVSEAGSIFVSAASYRDSNCPALVRSAFAQADRPELVRVGIVQQNCNGECQVGTGWANTRRVVPQPKPDVDCIQAFCESEAGRPRCENGQVEILRLEERESYGPFFARYLATKQWKGETYFLQLDAHSEFRPGWDAEIRRQMKATPSYPRTVISNYPPSHTMRFDDSLPSALCSVMFETLAGSGPDRRTTVRLQSSGRSVQGDVSVPRHSAFIAAGFYAAHASFIRKFNFDPFMPFLFMGEEIAMSVRFWTHGFDIYGPSKDIIRHEYIRKESMKFWESVGMVLSNPGIHNDLTHLLIPRVQHLVGFPEASDPSSVTPKSVLMRMEEFGLGKERSLAAFLDVTGLDMARKVSRPQAWCTRGTLPKGTSHSAALMVK